MINRLKSLTLENFRIFTKLVEVNLDSDVVLIYGPNGSGKTSIINGIETALTGEVSDLAILGKDYPRSLVNVDAQHSAITLGVDFKGCDRSIKARIDSEVVTNSPLDTPQKEFFQHRCYLSQPRFQKILEIYATFEKDGLGGVGFLKELFGSGILDEAINGLVAFGNKRTLANSLEVYSTLDKNLDEQKTRLLQVKRDLRELEIDAVEQESKTRAIISRVFANESDVEYESTLESISYWIKKLEDLPASDHPQIQLDKFRELQNSLRASIKIIERSGGHTELVALEKSVSMAQQIELKLSASERSLLEVVEVVEESLEMLEVYPYLDSKPPRIDLRMALLGESLKSRQVQLQDQTRRQSTLNQELEEAKSNLSKVEIELKGVEETISGSETENMLSALSTFLAHVDNESCPVCDRDFMEVSNTPLRDHIRKKIENLGKDLDKFGDTNLSIVKLRSQLQEWRSRTEVLEHQIASFNTDQATLAQYVDKCNHLIEVLSNRSTEIAQLSDLYGDLEKAKSQINLSKTKLKQQQESIDQISDIADEIGIEIEPVVQPDEMFWSPIDQEINQKLENMESKSELLKRLVENLEGSKRLALSVTNLTSNIQKLTTSIRKLENAKSEANDFVEIVRSIRRKAISAKELIYKDIFNDKLNTMYADLFIRLVNSERFVPAIREPYRDRAGQLFSGIKAMLKGEDKFEHARSVLSAGNINTAALSLFLTLNLMEQTMHNVLVLDDPVQSMDDVKVSQLAKTIRAINSELDRQVVIAIHERPLFNHLQLELSPRKCGESLMCVELTHDGKSHDVECTLIHWSRDRVKLEGIEV